MMKREHDFDNDQSSKRTKNLGAYSESAMSYTNNQHRKDAPQQQSSSLSAHTPEDLSYLSAALSRYLSSPANAMNAHGAPDVLRAASTLQAFLTSRRFSDEGRPAGPSPESISLSGPPSYTLNANRRHDELPPLPSVPEGPYSKAPFTHKSMTSHDRTVATDDLTYERLEFLGDAYIEIIATRLIFSRYSNFAAGRQAQIRERIVRNDTLAQFGVAYGFLDRLKANEQERRNEGARGGGKILADVFEAFVAAVILSDPATGFQRAETWLTELWAPILLNEYGPGHGAEISAETYNPRAKQELQQKIHEKGIKLEYLEDRPMQQSKHSQKYFISLYLTGWGHEKKLLGYGEGQNKVEAGNKAAMEAMAKNKAIVDKAAKELTALREKRRLEKQALEAAHRPSDGTTPRIGEKRARSEDDEHQG